MSILVLAELEAVPGKEEEYVTRLSTMLVDTRAFDGCESVTLHQDQDTPTHFMLVERWGSKQHHQAYLKWRADQSAAAPAATPLTTGPPAIRYFDDRA